VKRDAANLEVHATVRGSGFFAAGRAAPRSATPSGVYAMEGPILEIIKPMHSKAHVRTTINGEEIEFLCEPRQSLLECLRDIAGLTGTKEGCNDGNCGSCTVVFDGRIVPSCLVFGVEAQGRAITTIEGIAEGNLLHPIQQAFLEGAALQCGVCTPGFIVAAKALLDQEPDPPEERVRLWLANNLCRCTGYDKIIRAVMDAAAKRREEVPA
jgi:carbon-monoxide dehydrogenase small subunit